MATAGSSNGGRISRALSTLLPIVREGGPITLLVLLVLGGLSLYFLNGQLTRQQQTTKELVHLLLAEKDARLADMVRCAHKE